MKDDSNSFSDVDNLLNRKFYFLIEDSTVFFFHKLLKEFYV